MTTKHYCHLSFSPCQKPNMAPGVTGSSQDRKYVLVSARPQSHSNDTLAASILDPYRSLTRLSRTITEVHVSNVLRPQGPIDTRPLTSRPAVGHALFGQSARPKVHRGSCAKEPTTVAEALSLLRPLRNALQACESHVRPWRVYTVNLVLAFYLVPLEIKRYRSITVSSSEETIPLSSQSLNGNGLHSL